jgi:probable F420-dependent oxidoreductase
MADLMRHGIVLFTSDRGITPARAAVAAEERGFDTFYVPEHTHIPVKREAAHPRTGDATLPDDRYTRTLDPWVSLATAAAATSRIGLATAVALPVESDPITLAKTIATLDHLSGGRVTLGAGFGWNTDELADHGVPAGSRRTVLLEYLEAMRALWTQEHASFSGSFVNFGPSWAFPKPARPHIPVIIGAGGGPATFAWIAEHADGWMTTPGERDIPGKAASLRAAWASCDRDGVPDIRVLISARPSPSDLSDWASAGVSELLWGLPDAPPDAVEAYLDRLAARVAQDSR